jgi:hypothetical protein
VGEPSSQKPGRPAGRVAITYPAPWVFVGVITGHYAVSLLDEYVAGMAVALDREHRMQAFHDWYRMSGYESACRKRMTEWTLEQGKKIERHHVLLQSKLVAMGVATANLLLGGDMITAYTERAGFEAALYAACRK